MGTGNGADFDGKAPAGAEGGGGAGVVNAPPRRARSKKRRHMSAAQEKEADKHRSLVEVIAHSIDAKRIGQRLLAGAQDDAGDAVGKLVDRLAAELLGAVIGGPGCAEGAALLSDSAHTPAHAGGGGAFDEGSRVHTVDSYV